MAQNDAPAPEMIRCIAVLEARTEDTLEHNQALWRANDPFMALEGAGVARYLRSLSRRTEDRAFRPRTRLGAAQFWVTDLDRALTLCKALKARQLVGDHPVLRDASVMVLATRERAVIPRDPPPAGAEGLRALFFVRRKPGMSVADYQAYWFGVHGQLVIGTPGIVEYRQCHVCPESYGALSPEYDGMAEMTWSDEAGRAAFSASPKSRIEQTQDLPNLFDLKAGFRFFVSEETLF